MLNEINRPLAEMVAATANDIIRSGKLFDYLRHPGVSMFFAKVGPVQWAFHYDQKKRQIISANRLRLNSACVEFECDQFGLYPVRCSIAFSTMRA